MDINTLWSNPGLYPLVQTQDVTVWTGRESHIFEASLPIVSTAVDSGNSPTTTLRAGLPLGKITATGLYKQYDPAAVDGSQICVAFLKHGVSMLDYAGVAADKTAPCLLMGTALTPALLNLDNMARRQLMISNRINFSDDLAAGLASGGLPLYEIAKAANYTVVAGDVGALFTTTGASGAVTFTLPALAPGLGPFEFLNLVDQNMIVASAAGDDMVVINDLSADSVAFSTASQKIGGRIQVCANAAGTKWYVRNMSPGNTLTIAT